MKFHDEIWDKIVSFTTDIFGLTPDKSEVLRNNIVAKIIAAIPYLAECYNPDRSAISHLGTYIISQHSLVHYIYSLRASDTRSINARLVELSQFDGGDRKIIERGMNLLHLTMISSYRGVRSTDSVRGGKSKSITRKGNGGVSISKLVRQIESVECKEMDEIFPVTRALQGEWYPPSSKEIAVYMERKDRIPGLKDFQTVELFL
jgi:hypothetical protein